MHIKIYRSTAKNWNHALPRRTRGARAHLRTPRPLLPLPIDAWTTANRPGPRPSNVYRDLVILIAATACRPGEALAVRREDVDLDYEIAPGVRKPVQHIGTIVYDEAEGGLFRQPYTKSNDAGDGCSR